MRNLSFLADADAELMLIAKAKAKAEVLSSKAFLYFAKLWIEGMVWYGEQV